MDQIRVAVGVILAQTNVVLVARRPEHLHQGGLLEFPGGKVEPGESIEQALCREVEEELGVDITQTVKRPLTQIHHSYKDKEVFLEVWLVNGYKGEPTGLEGQELHLIAIPELNPSDFPAANLSIINLLKSSYT